MSVIQLLDQGVIKSAEAAYRGRLIRKTLFNMVRQRPTEINVYMALEMLAAVWTATSSSVIEKCFRHAGFGRPASAASPTPEVNVHLRRPGTRFAVQVIRCLTSLSWRTLDGIAHEEFSDDAIIDSVHLGQDTDDEDGEREEKRQVNPRDVLDAFDVIRNFLSENEDNKAMGSIKL